MSRDFFPRIGNAPLDSAARATAAKVEGTRDLIMMTAFGEMMSTVKRVS